MQATRADIAVGLLGCGLWGRRILTDLVALGVRVHVVDEDAGAREHALANGAAAASAALQQASSLAGWIVATPASAHLDNLRALAGSGLPLLCEKPLCVDATQAREMEQLAFVDCHMLDVWRYHPAVETLSELVHAGSLGTPLGLRSTRINWTSPRTDVDSLANLGPHEISIYREVFDGEWPRPVGAFFEHDQAGAIRSACLQWRGGPWMLSELGNRSPLRRRELRLHCTDGVALWDAATPDTLLLARGESDAQLEASMQERLRLGTGMALRRQLHAWLDWLRGDGPPPRSDLADGIRAIDCIEQMRRLGSAA